MMKEPIENHSYPLVQTKWSLRSMSFITVMMSGFGLLGYLMWIAIFNYWSDSPDEIILQIITLSFFSAAWILAGISYKKFKAYPANGMKNSLMQPVGLCIGAILVYILPYLMFYICFITPWNATCPDGQKLVSSEYQGYYCTQK